MSLRVRNIPDAILAARVRAGEEGAFAELHARHHRALERYARRILGSDALAEEVVQEAFLKAHRALARGDHLTLRPWLYRVVRNGALDVLRAHPAAAELGDHELPGADPAVQVLVAEEVRAVLRDIAALPERQREVLLRRELEGASIREVARDMAVTERAVKSLGVRARESLAAGVRARDARCDDVRALLVAAHRERRRAAGSAHRHMRECASCREFRSRLHGARHAMRILTPPPLLGLLGLTGGGGGALALKTAAVAGAGTLIFAAGTTQPHVIPAASVLAAPLAPGDPVPQGTALLRRTVHVSPARVMRTSLTCPTGMVVAGAAPQPAQTTSWGLDPTTTVGADRTAQIRVARGEARRVAIVVLCKVPRSDGSVLAGSTTLARAARADVRKVCVRRAYLFEAPGVATIGSVYRGQPVVLRRLTKGRQWAAIRTDSGLRGWVRASALCLRPRRS